MNPTDPIEKQRPLLIWGTDPDKVDAAHALLVEAGIRCSEVVEGMYYSLFCAYLDKKLPGVLDARLRALVSRVQASLSRT